MLITSLLSLAMGCTYINTSANNPITLEKDTYHTNSNNVCQDFEFDDVQSQDYVDVSLITFDISQTLNDEVVFYDTQCITLTPLINSQTLPDNFTGLAYRVTTNLTEKYSLYFSVGFSGCYLEPDTSNHHYFTYQSGVYPLIFTGQTNLDEIIVIGQDYSFDSQDEQNYLTISLYLYLMDVHTFNATASSYTDSYNQGYTDGKYVGFIDGYQDGRSDGLIAGQTLGYQEGYAVGSSLATNDFGFMNLFGAIADTPIMMLYSLFNFDLFGTPVLTIILSLFTGMMLIFVIRKFI